MGPQKKSPPAADKPRWNQDDYHKEFAGKLKEQIEQGVALPAKIAETLYPLEISVEGGEVSGR